MGQPGILTGDTRVSHTSPKVSPVSIPGCPTSSPSFPLIPRVGVSPKIRLFLRMAAALLEYMVISNPFDPGPLRVMK